MARRKLSQALIAGAATVGTAGVLAGVGTLLLGRAMWDAVTTTTALSGKVVLITGASRGLGLALAEECARQGCRLAICGRDQQSLTRAESELRRRGTEVLALRCDISS